MLFTLAISLILVGTYFSYRYSKALGECVTYSKNNQLQLLGWEATSEIALMSNVFFFVRLLKLGGGEDIQDTEQRRLLVLSRKELLMALSLCFLGAGLAVVSAIAR